jgi:hypothetical protein
MAEWIVVILTAVGLAGSLIAVLVRVSIALSKNTDATERLTKVIDKHEAKIEALDIAIDDHEVRIGKIETIHKLRNCDKR